MQITNTKFVDKHNRQRLDTTHDNLQTHIPIWKRVTRQQNCNSHKSTNSWTWTALGFDTKRRWKTDESYLHSLHLLTKFHTRALKCI